MTKIALIAATFLVAMGTAFAGSDNYGSINVNQPVAMADASYTASIQKSDEMVREPVTQGSDRDLFGNH
ncbi:MAG: DUF680 domain-containing protein [Pseudomonadota bacterium]|jgi:Na+/H+ antiporter NhaC